MAVVEHKLVEWTRIASGSRINQAPERMFLNVLGGGTATDAAARLAGDDRDL